MKVLSNPTLHELMGTFGMIISIVLLLGFLGIMFYFVIAAGLMVFAMIDDFFNSVFTWTRKQKGEQDGKRS